MDPPGHGRATKLYGRRRPSRVDRTSWRISGRDNHAISRAVPESEEVKHSRQQRFTESTETIPASKITWSSAVWKENDQSRSGTQHAQQGNGSASAQQCIGLGRAAGFSRTPNPALSSSREMMDTLLARSLERLKGLEDKASALVNIQEQTLHSLPKFNNAMAAWEALLADFRQLTMAVTASSSRDVQKLCVEIYEGSADASLLAGNLSLYLACQTRLLSDLYNLYPKRAGRRAEFTGYALLYFGVFCADNLEVAQILRTLGKGASSSTTVKFSLSILTAFQNRNARQFLSLYRQCSSRQKTLINSAVEPVRKTLFAEMLRAYMTLDKDIAVCRLHLSSRDDFLNLLQAERPDLMVVNCGSSSEYQFRGNGSR